MIRSIVNQAAREEALSLDALDGITAAGKLTECVSGLE